ncbi:hypothetical protein ACFWVC_27265 [Streptomyces sp. NPDC058691]|uniref:hypothetical protein n=1 Tax=Streptomyces sp. NPDC058691 TaxID=3346601 RepID=UPI003667FD74
MSLGQDGPPTRTRLPESPGGTGGPARRPARSGRSLVTVVGVVVLLIAAIAFVNRGGDHGGGTAGSGNGDRATGGTAAQPTAATGTRPVDGKSAGIPTGYSRTDQGAQSAAANYAVALGSDGMFAPDRRAAIVSTVYAPDVAVAQRRDLDGVYSDPAFLGRIGLSENGTPPDGMTFVSRTTPVGTKLDDIGDDSAVVEVWYSSLFGLAGEGSTNPVSESWYTNTFRLKWVGGDWKIVDFEQKDGPTPVGRDQTASSADEMSDAVNGFGGFTYAR